MSKNQQKAWSIRRLFSKGIEEITGEEICPTGSPKFFRGRLDTDHRDNYSDFRTGEYYLTYNEAATAAELKKEKSINELRATLVEREGLSFPLQEPV